MDLKQHSEMYSVKFEQVLSILRQDRLDLSQIFVTPEDLQQQISDEKAAINIHQMQIQKKRDEILSLHEELNQLESLEEELKHKKSVSEEGKPRVCSNSATLICNFLCSHQRQPR